MLKPVKVLIAGLILASGLSAGLACAADVAVTYERGRVQAVQTHDGAPDTLRIQLQSGTGRGSEVTAAIGSPPGSLDLAPPRYQPGDSVILSRQVVDGAPAVYVVTDHYRLPVAGWLLAVVLGLAILFAGWRGVGSLAGLILSVAVLAGFVVPQILHGQNPYLITAAAIAVISSIGMFVAHGFSRRTAFALLATYITLAIAVILSVVAVSAMHLTGVTDENILYLSQAKPTLNVAGLLLCGMLISLIGILDDVTVGQAATVEELYKANIKLSPREVYGRGLKIGREHIASLINTLVLVFVGTSFLFVTYLSALSPYPWYINLNSGIIMQEVVRALVGSVALILAVPIATVLAARFLRPTGSSSHR